MRSWWWRAWILDLDEAQEIVEILVFCHCSSITTLVWARHKAALVSAAFEDATS